MLPISKLLDPVYVGSFSTTIVLREASLRKTLDTRTIEFVVLYITEKSQLRKFEWREPINKICIQTLNGLTTIKVVVFEIPNQLSRDSESPIIQSDWIFIGEHQFWDTSTEWVVLKVPSSMSWERNSRDYRISSVVFLKRGIFPESWLSNKELFRVKIVRENTIHSIK